MRTESTYTLKIPLFFLLQLEERPSTHSHIEHTQKLLIACRVYKPRKAKEPTPKYNLHLRTWLYISWKQTQAWAPISIMRVQVGFSPSTTSLSKCILHTKSQHPWPDWLIAASFVEPTTTQSHYSSLVAAGKLLLLSWQQHKKIQTKTQELSFATTHKQTNKKLYRGLSTGDGKRMEFCFERHSSII